MIEEFKGQFDENLFKLYKDVFNYHLDNTEGFFKEKSDDELKESLKEQLNKDNKYTLVYIDKRIIGYIMFKIDGDSIFLSELSIDENYRNNQIATRLIKEVEKIAKEKHIKYIDLNCWSFNEAAETLYEYLGFKRIRSLYRKEC